MMPSSELGTVKVFKGGKDINFEQIDENIDKQIEDKFREIYPDIEVIEKSDLGVPGDYDNYYAFLQLSNKAKKEYRELLFKKRPELVERGLNDINKLQKLAFHWILKGNVIMPEDGYKIIDAYRIAKIKKFLLIYLLNRLVCGRIKLTS